LFNDFLADLLAGFLDGFFLAEALFAGFALLLDFRELAAFFGREALPVRARDLAAFLKLRLLTVVLLAIATTISF